MTDAPTIDPAATRQALAVEGRSGRLKVTGKLRNAIDAMVWQGARRPEAAETSGLTDHSLRSALKKPHVKQYYLQQIEVLRTSERARNIHALADVRDGTNAMARVAAVKALEQLSDETQARSNGSVSLPGLVINIVHSGEQPKTIDVTPQELTRD